MELVQTVIVILQITNILARKRIKVRDDSIENILYYKDCNHKSKTSERPILRTAVQPQQECKMCCTMCCGDQCINTNKCANEQPTPQRSSPILGSQNPPLIDPLQPNPELKLLDVPLQPITGRRDLNTKDYIKNLISQDGDIRKILKDLVRVTMQKVTLMKMMYTRRAEKKDGDASEESYASDEEL